MFINLVRKYLFQPKNLINDDTPDDVLFFLVETCGKKISYKDMLDKRKKIIDFLSNYSYKLDTEQLSKKDLLQISSFVSNKKSKWTKEQLLSSLEYINNFDSETNWLDFGDITPVEPNNLDISMLYYLCYNKDIILEKHDTYNDMKYKYLHYTSKGLERKDLISDIILKLNSMKKDDLFSLYNRCKKIIYSFRNF